MYCSVLLFLSGSDLMLIMFVALLLFGGDKLPEIARGLGKGIRDFKEASEGVKREINNQINNFEEKKAEQEKAAPAALPPASETVADEVKEPEPAAEPEHNAPEIRITSAPNSVPIAGMHIPAATDEQVADTHADEPKKSETEPIKTT
ncbi:MAG: Sec-independent protein translocase subunit TatA/TatB [Mucilaginibacter sp.]